MAVKNDEDDEEIGFYGIDRSCADDVFRPSY